MKARRDLKGLKNGLSILDYVSVQGNFNGLKNSFGTCSVKLDISAIVQISILDFCYNLSVFIAFLKKFTHQSNLELSVPTSF